MLNLKPQKCRPQWPRGLRRRSTAARLLRFWIRAPGPWMSLCCECCVLSGRGPCHELVTRPEEAYWLWCVVVCVLETSWMRRPWPTGGAVAPNEKKAPKITQCQTQFRALLSMWLKCYVFFRLWSFRWCTSTVISEQFNIFWYLKSLFSKHTIPIFRQQLGIFTEYWGINRCTKENRNSVTYRFVSTRHLSAVVVPSWRTWGPHRASFSTDKLVVGQVSLKVSSLIIGWLEC
jgi:hypothetical protein